MPQPQDPPKPQPLGKGPLPIAAPARSRPEDRKPGAPDLRVEEIEERHIPKDRNIFDK